MTNREIAQALRATAAGMVLRHENLYRVRAVRRAAMAVLEMAAEAAELVATGGAQALEQVPGIGKSLAGTIAILAAAGPEPGPLAA